MFSKRNNIFVYGKEVEIFNKIVAVILFGDKVKEDFYFLLYSFL